MFFGLCYSKKEAEQLAKEAGAKEYLRGAEATAKAFKDKEDDIASSKTRLLDDWATLKRAQAELDNNKATLILDGIKDIFASSKPDLNLVVDRLPRWY